MYNVKATRSSKGVNVNKELIAMSNFDEQQRVEMRLLLFTRHFDLHFDHSFYLYLLVHFIYSLLYERARGLQLRNVFKSLYI